MKASPRLPLLAAIACSPLWLSAAPVRAAVSAVVLNPTFLEYPKITPSTPDLRVGHAFQTGPDGRSYVRYVDFDGDGAWEVRLHGDKIQAVQAEAASGVELMGIPYNNFYVFPCPKGAIIGEDNVFHDGTSVTEWSYPHDIRDNTILWGSNPPWGGEDNRFPFMGVRFQKEDGWHYGWIQVAYYLGSTGFLSGWAWETEPDTPITAGAIPEPSAAGLSLAAASLFFSRRRRRADATPPVRGNPRQ